MILTTVPLALVSGWTALTELAVAVGWFARPNLVLLAPVPVVTAVVVLALWRSLWSASEMLTFRLAALLYLLGFAGLVVSQEVVTFSDTEAKICVPSFRLCSNMGSGA